MAGQCFGQFCFACTCGAQEQETAHGLALIANACKADVHTFQHSVHSRILTVQLLFDVAFQFHNLGTAFVLQLVHRHTGHTTQLLFNHGFCDCDCACVLDTFPSTCCINEIDTFVWVFAIMDVSIGQLHCTRNGFGINENIVKLFESGRKTNENLFGSVSVRFINAQAIKTSHKSAVFFKAFIVFFPGSRRHNLQAAFGDSRLQHVGKVQTAVGTGTCTFHGVCFVHKQDTVLSAFQCSNHRLELFFKVAAIFAAGQQRTNFQTPYFVILDKRRHTSGHNFLGQALHNSSLAHTWIAYHQDVGLELASQHSDHFLYFFASANHGF